MANIIVDQPRIRKSLTHVPQIAEKHLICSAIPIEPLRMFMEELPGDKIDPVQSLRCTAFYRLGMTVLEIGRGYLMDQELINLTIWIWRLAATPNAQQVRLYRNKNGAVGEIPTESMQFPQGRLASGASKVYNDCNGRLRRCRQWISG